MKRPSAPTGILAPAILMAVCLVGLVVREGAARAGGQEVVLEIAGYDPRSLLSGHYVQFQLRSEGPPGAPCPPGANDDDLSRKGWVALRRDGDNHKPAGVTDSREAALQLGDVAVRGSVRCSPLDSRTAAILDLGIDRFYADQAQAEAIQRRIAGMPDPSAAQAVVSVGRDGQARLSGLIVGGRRTDLRWF